jgi:hypothetical protein
MKPLRLSSCPAFPLAVRRLVPFCTALLLANTGLHAQSSSAFIAGSGEWFDDLNWSAGTFPDGSTNATLDGVEVRLDARGLATPLAVQNVTLVNRADLEVRAARLQLVDLTSTDSALHTHSAHLVVTRLRVFQPTPCIGFSCGSIKLNPSLVEAQEFTLGDANVRTTFGLGGTSPATAAGLGAGHYARVVCAAATLQGTLDVEFLYGFAPVAGQQFKIIDFTGSGAINGRFAQAPEGALVARHNGVGLYLSYAGGDGNDVVLTAAALPVATAPLVYAVNNGAWSDPLTWSDGQAPSAAKEHILLARQIGAPMSAPPGQTVTVKSLTLREGSSLILRNLKFVADSISLSDSILRTENSHVSANLFEVVELTNGWGQGGPPFNPSLVEAQVFDLERAAGMTTSFGLGGTSPAAADALGAGRYARVVCDTAKLGGNLAITYHYGFAPQAGQQFEIIHVNTPGGGAGGVGLSGRFTNAPEGALVSRYNNVGLTITYAGGDGNDVVLTAQTLPVSGTPLVHAVQNGDGLAALVWSDGHAPTAARGEHVLFARQIAMAAATSGQSLNLQSLTLLEHSDLGLTGLNFHADALTVSDSTLHTHGAHLVLDRLRVFQPTPCIGFGCGTIKLNPSLVEAQEFTLEGDVTTTFGLGGAAPALATALGAGHYARVVTPAAALDGTLSVEFLYGFRPQVGQQFKIIANTSALPVRGRFVNVREGGAVAVVDDLVLVLSYAGGDGNDVVLTAQPRPVLAIAPANTSPGALLLSFPTTHGHFYRLESSPDLAPGNWSPRQVFLGDGTLLSAPVNTGGESRTFYRLFGDPD